MRALRWWGWPLVPVYWAGLRLKDGLRRLGVLPVQTSQWPVVSVGSLSAGGAGKTPVVIALAEMLQNHAWSVHVLSRGYGRSGSGVEPVDVRAPEAAARFGDEPVLIARRTSVPVWVASQRFLAGEAAESASKTQTRCLHLLDDGFQHRGLARTMDVVVVTAEDLDDALLPAGNLREGLRALRRADALVVREEERGSVLPRLAGMMRADAAVWMVRRTVEFPGADALFHPGPGPMRTGLIAFCAIARPSNFFDSVRDAGGRLVDSIAFPDHYRYTATDMGRLIEACREWAGDGFVTTEKDAVKLTPEMRAQLDAVAPLLVARLTVAFADADAVVRAVEARIS